MNQSINQSINFNHKTGSTLQHKALQGRKMRAPYKQKKYQQDASWQIYNLQDESERLSGSLGQTDAEFENEVRKVAIFHFEFENEVHFTKTIIFDLN